MSNFDTSKVTNMGGMFMVCEKLLNLNISNFDISNITYVKYMFLAMPINTTIKVKDVTVQSWVLGLSSSDRPSSWSTSNVIIKT